MANKAQNLRKAASIRLGRTGWAWWLHHHRTTSKCTADIVDSNQPVDRRCSDITKENEPGAIAIGALAGPVAIVA
jgi:hypothetical protein